MTSTYFPTSRTIQELHLAPTAVLPFPLDSSTTIVPGVAVGQLTASMRVGGEGKA